jgi:endoglucanase
VAAYDLLNEPVTTDADGQQWQSFATRLVEEVRRVDRNHLLIIGKLYGVHSAYTTDGVASQFLVADNNVMYDFHFYEPIDYTHQYASWIARPMGDGGRYPDPEIFLPTGRQVYITSLTEENPRQLALKHTWQKVEQIRYRVDNQRITMAVPTIVASEVGGATVYFDHLVVTEYDKAGRFVRVVIDEPLSGESVWQWWGWHSPAEGRNATFTRVQDEGVNDSYSLAISNVRGATGVSGWTGDHLWFRVKQGHAYNISGHLRADGLTNAAENAPPISAYIDLAFYGEPEGAVGFVARDRKYLEQEFKELYRFGQEHNVPMSVMEFGLMRATFEMKGKGGAQWVSDMLDIFNEYQVSFSYWNYHGDRMGLYLTESGEPPGNPNQDLIRTLRSKLHK